MKAHILIVPTYHEQRMKTKEGVNEALLELLYWIRKTGSINQASKKVDCVYSKAWTDIKAFEKEHGKPLLHTKGACGSELTEYGIELLEEYDKFRRSVMRSEKYKRFKEVYFEKLPNPK